jgi:signal transduction histidine kinase
VGERGRPWRSVRARATIGATLVVAVALAIGATAFFLILRSAVLDSAERSAETRADEVAGRIETQGVGVIDGMDEEIARVVSAEGDTLAESEQMAGAAVDPGASTQLVTIDDEPTLVVADELDDGAVLLIGVSIEDDSETLGTVGLLLIAAVPLVLALVAATTWFVVARALGPVTRISDEVDGISAERLHRRVAVPDSGDEIATLAVTMNRMLDRLDASAAAQRQFVSDASHELRSPLATIRQHAELAQSHPEQTSVTELAEVVHGEGLRLQDIIDALLLLAGLDEQGTIGHAPVDLDDIALMESRRLRAAGIVVDSTGIDAGRVLGDERLLGQLVRNLTDNAARHCRAKVAIGLATGDGHVTLTVEDDGDGIPLEERERVFERFVRLDEARARDAGGSGLGLAIVQGIAATAGGTASVDDSRWGGARVTVTLPAAS